MAKTFKREFEKKIIELGFSSRSSHDGFYNICDENYTNYSVNAQLIESILPNGQNYGSKNGNYIQVIGVFEVKLPPDGQYPDLFIFALGNPFKKQTEYLIIPKEELRTRFLNKNLEYELGKRVEIVFWLMPDGYVYNTTHLSPEGEWYCLSKGINGRIADGTDMDYTTFLNNWEQLTVH
jgi:hypothetical protein